MQQSAGYSIPRDEIESMTTNVLFIASRCDIAGGIFRYMDRARFHPNVWPPGDGSFRETLQVAGVDSVAENVNHIWLKPEQKWYVFPGGLLRDGDVPARVCAKTATRGERLIQLEERPKCAKSAADLLLKNPLSRAARAVKRYFKD